jgi:RNA polymerase sigma-70 factor (ECF subfamily)
MVFIRVYKAMNSSATNNSGELRQLLQRAAQGDSQSWGILLEQHRKRLRRMVAIRLDQRLQARIDASDVIQEAYLEASARLEKYLHNPTVPFFLWLRFLTGQKLLELHRHHLGAQVRDAGREIALYRGTLPEASSAALAAQLLGRDPRPSEAAVRAERKIRLQEALNGMDPLDREVLALRHFEHLSNGEAAQVLGLQESAASKRYVRALQKLKEILAGMPGGLGEV